LNAFLRRFPAARLAMAPETLRWRRGLFLRGLERLPLVL
jgi:cytochrome P450